MPAAPRGALSKRRSRERCENAGEIQEKHNQYRMMRKKRAAEQPIDRQPRAAGNKRQRQPEPFSFGFVTDGPRSQHGGDRAAEAEQNRYGRAAGKSEAAEKSVR